MFAFGCSAGIVTFNTISEIMTSAPYNWSTSATGLLYLSALVGNFIGWATGAVSDQVVIILARRNGGTKEPEMRLWALAFPLVYAALGFQLYGWGAQLQLPWISIAIALTSLIAYQVAVCTIATAYIMECFPSVCLPSRDSQLSPRYHFLSGTRQPFHRSKSR